MTHTPLLLMRWKPYQPPKGLQDVLKATNKGIDSDKINLYHALPYSYLSEIDQAKLPEGVYVGCDNMLESQPDSYAAHFAGKMVADTKSNFVLIGDSDRRKFFDESDASISSKLHKALEAQLKVFLCVDDPRQQLSACLEGVTDEHLPHIVIVYQAPSAGFYENKGLVDDLQAGQALIQDMLFSLFGEASNTVPVILALPSHLENPALIVESTITGCQGYYLYNAILNPSAVSDMVKALTSYQPPQATQQPPIEEPLPEPIEEPIESEDDIWEEVPGDQEASEGPQEEE